MYILSSTSNPNPSLTSVYHFQLLNFHNYLHHPHSLILIVIHFSALPFPFPLAMGRLVFIIH